MSHFSARVRGAMRSIILLTHLAIDMAGWIGHYCAMEVRVGSEFVLVAAESKVLHSLTPRGQNARGMPVVKGR